MFAKTLNAARITRRQACDTLALKIARSHELRRYQNLLGARHAVLESDILLVDHCGHDHTIGFSPDDLSTVPGVLVIQRVAESDYFAGKLHQCVQQKSRA